MCNSNGTCKVIANTLLPKYIYILEGECFKEVVTAFERLWGFPQAAGAIDGSKILIKKPLESSSDYYNRKGFYSGITQALVDHKGRFMDICVGWPGNVHNTCIFANSTLYMNLMNCQLFSDMCCMIGGVNVTLVVLGDPAYPLLHWLKKLYPENEHTSADKKLFNYWQNCA